MTEGPDPCAEQRTISGPRDLVGFAASGGGFRATLFHTGGLIRMNELGLLPQVERFSGVSGGSITLGALAAAWPGLHFEGGRFPKEDFDKSFVRPVLRFSERRIDVPAVLWGLVPGQSPSDFLVRAYRDLVGRKTLQDLPVRPQFTFNASSLQTGVLVRFTRAYLRDYRAGCLAYPKLELAVAIAASSAFPPYLSPNVIRPPAPGLRGGEDALADPRYHTRLVLTDGGVYDNLGLQTLTGFRTVIASDGGGPGTVEPAPTRFFFKQVVRVLGIANEQTRALRRHALVDDIRQGRKLGTLWTIKTDINRYKAPPGPALLRVHRTQIADLAAVKTRLWPYPEATRLRLVNWGYALADAGLRVYVGATGPAPSWPFGDHPLDGAIATQPEDLSADGLDAPPPLPAMEGVV
jgi:NTE family protein